MRKKTRYFCPKFNDDYCVMPRDQRGVGDENFAAFLNAWVQYGFCGWLMSKYFYIEDFIIPDKKKEFNKS